MCAWVVWSALAWPGTAAAGVQAVQAPLLADVYAPAPQLPVDRTADVGFVPPRVLASVGLRVAGSVATGVVSCEGGDMPAGVALTVSVLLEGGATAVPLFTGATGGVKDFDLLLDPVHEGAPLPSDVEAALLAGQLVLQLSVALAWPPGCDAEQEDYEPPYAVATVGTVTLLVEGDFPVDDTSRAWGRVKIQYR